MTEWISISDKEENVGFTLELLLQPERVKSEIRLLHAGNEVARGPAVRCTNEGVVWGIEPGTHRERPFYLHDDEILWLAEKLGIIVELKAEVDEEDDQD